MIKNILLMLTLNEHYNQSENIEIAKGKYELQTTFKSGFKQIKRQWLKLK
jgi:hypothetical protein